MKFQDTIVLRELEKEADRQTDKRIKMSPAMRKKSFSHRWIRQSRSVCASQQSDALCILGSLLQNHLIVEWRTTNYCFFEWLSFCLKTHPLWVILCRILEEGTEELYVVEKRKMAISSKRAIERSKRKIEEAVEKRQWQYRNRRNTYIYPSLPHPPTVARTAGPYYYPTTQTNCYIAPDIKGACFQPITIDNVFPASILYKSIAGS